MRYHVRIRKFLNRVGHHAGAHVIAEVEDSASCRDKECDHRWCGEATLYIADCTRRVSLDFDLETASDRRNSLYKIDTLIDALTQFRAALVIEAERAAARERKPRKTRD